MSEFVSDALDHTLFQRSLKTIELDEMELVVASLGRVSLDGGWEELISGLCGLLYSLEDHVHDESVAELLQHALVKHGGRPCFGHASVKHSHAINVEASFHVLDFGIFEN